MTDAIYPPAEAVARVIVACARLTEVADPAMVVTTRRHRGKTEFDKMRARVYAAQVLHDLYPLCPKAAIDRCVGAWPGGNFLSNLDWRVKHGSLHWYDAGVVEKVAAPERAIEAEPEPLVITSGGGGASFLGPPGCQHDESEYCAKCAPPPRAPVPSSLAGTPIKRIESSLLFEAVRNTQPRVEE